MFYNNLYTPQLAQPAWYLVWRSRGMIHQEKITQGFKWCILEHTHVQMWSFFLCGPERSTSGSATAFSSSGATE